MDLRDKFACQAMNGFISGFCTHENTAAIDQLSHDVLAKEAYVVADCMIEARKTSEQGESPATTGNSDYTAALEVELHRAFISDVFGGNESSVHELATRLNSVVKAQQNCA